MCIAPAISQCMERASYFAYGRIRDVRIPLRGANVGVAQEFLHIANINPILEKVCCKTVPKRMKCHSFLNVRFIGCVLKYFLSGSFCDSTSAVTFE